MMNFDEAFAESPIHSSEIEPASHAVEPMKCDSIVSQLRITLATHGKVDLLPALRPCFRATGYTPCCDRHARLKSEHETFKLFVRPFLPLFMDALETGAQ
ncbi:hypothetical protein [Limimaricola cinnabarinus]|uniref:hypothetical protein n=1 Tax=Limimaricola cinnabarinus TaxID=1125964 RepID=UPI002491421C|nr:hypothetical protein [Limimaricola cinnabarinus]